MLSVCCVCAKPGFVVAAVNSFYLGLSYSWVVLFKEARWTLTALGPLEGCWLLQRGVSASQPQSCLEAPDFQSNEGTKLTVKQILRGNCCSLSSCLKGIQFKKEPLFNLA